MMHASVHESVRRVCVSGSFCQLTRFAAMLAAPLLEGALRLVTSFSNATRLSLL